jgi:hypothetical protein
VTEKGEFMQKKEGKKIQKKKKKKKKRYRRRIRHNVLSFLSVSFVFGRARTTKNTGKEERFATMTRRTSIASRFSGGFETR